MRVTRHAYAVDGWGVGELWVARSLVVHHVLPGGDGSPRKRGDGDAALSGLHAAGESSSGLAAAPDPRRLHGPAPTLLAEPEPRVGGPSGPGENGGDVERKHGSAFAQRLCLRFSRQLAGEPTSYADVAIELDWATAFQAALVAALRSITWGEVVSYGELAALAGRPRAARAAGALCADNRFALIVPCHRVVAAGGIGGYGPAGVALKRRLLALEGVEL